MYLLKLRTDELTVVENHYPENLYPVFGQLCASGSARIHSMEDFLDPDPEVKNSPKSCQKLLKT